MLKYAQDWAFTNGEEPKGDYVADFQSHYPEEQREYIQKIMRMMRFANSLGNTLSRKSSNSDTESSSAACIIQNRDYAHEHDHIVAHPPVIFGIVLAVGFILQKFYPVAIMANPGTLFKVLASLLFVISGAIMVSTTRLMLRRKTDPRPDRPTSTIVTEGLFRYSRNPLYLSVMLIYSGITIYANSLWLVILFPVLLIALERGVVVCEEKYLEGKFGEEYLKYKKMVRRWI